MILNLTLLIFGLILVAKGGELFVDSSVHLARVLGIPRIVIGATLVSVATTFPELTVSVTASIMGDSGIALGNAVGSAIANIGLVVGVVAILVTVQVDRADFRRRFLWMLGSAVLVIFLTRNRILPSPMGWFLFTVSIAYLFYDYWKIRKSPTGEAPSASKNSAVGNGLGKSSFLFLVGMFLVIAGSQMLVHSGIAIAAYWGVPSVIIGLSVIAVGTSLPELVTGIVAARKKVPDLAIGNIVGANILNLALILGLSSMIHPLTLDRFTQFYSFPWLLLFMVMMFWMLGRDGKASRREGWVFVVLYVLYLAGLIVVPAWLSSLT